MKKRGISLIVLIVTIIVIIILAAVVITVSINSGIIENARKAKNDTEVSEEKEIIQEAVVMAKGLSKTGMLIQEDFQHQINKIAGEGNATIYSAGEDFEVLFNTKRVYRVDNNGYLLEEIEYYEKSTHSFFAQIENNNLGKTEETAYEINSIEDLVDLCYAVNGIKVEQDGTLTSSSSKIIGNHIKLLKDLNFKSPLSYENSTRTDYGDINQNGEVEKLFIELTTGKGWIPIGGGLSRNRSNLFNKIFNGNNKKISNLYIHNEVSTSDSGLFGRGQGIILKDLGVQGKIYCNSDAVGGIIGSELNSEEIYNCYFEGEIENIKTNGVTGGILGNAAGLKEITNCYSKGELIANGSIGGIGGGHSTEFKGITITNSHNEAKILGKGNAGGIWGTAFQGLKIISCYNIASITSTGSKTGGIAGGGFGIIENCYNTGVISGGEYVGGIAGHTCQWTKNNKITNCYNSGSILVGVKSGGILGRSWANLTIDGCYNVGEIKGGSMAAGIVGVISEASNKILNCYNTGFIKGEKSAGIFFSGASYLNTNKAVACYNLGRLEPTGNVKCAIMDVGIASNCFYLDTCGATDSHGTSLSETELKTITPTLDKAFTIDDESNTITLSDTEVQNIWISNSTINNGYPILKWQE